MKVSELYRKLLKVHVDGPDDEIGGGTVQTVEAGSNITVDSTDPAHPVVAASGGGGGGIQPGEPMTEIVGDDGGVGYESPSNVPVFALRDNGKAHDRVQVWANGYIFFGDGTAPPTAYINGGVSAAQLSAGNSHLALQDNIAEMSSGAPGGIVSLGAGTDIVKFFGGSGSTQHAAIADATDPASTQARVNDLLAAMRALGLIAT